MNKFKLVFMIAFFIFLLTNYALAVEYPIISIGLNGGWGQNELKDGYFARGFLRYSLEAYIPGFQIDVSYCHSGFNELEKEEEKDPDPETSLRTTEVNMRDNCAAISGTFHLRPFEEMTVFYFGGGVNFNFIRVDKKKRDKYWDPVGEKYQELETESYDLYNQNLPGFHVLGGFRFLLGKFGSLDIEARQTFLTIEKDDWELEARDKYGDKSWNNLSVNLGLTIFVF